MMNTGWNCPACGRAHGPHVDTCPEQNTTAHPPRPNLPMWPYTGYDGPGAPVDPSAFGTDLSAELPRPRDPWATEKDRSTLDAEATTSSAQPPLDVPSMPL